MKRLLLILCLVTFADAQTKEQRYQISKLGTVDDFDLTILLDTQTGKTWQLAKDTVLVEQHRSKLVRDIHYIWKPIFFTPNSIPVAPRYTALPDSTR